MSYTSKDGAVWDGAVPDENNELQCEKCGSKKVRVVAHFDGAKTYGYIYNCENGHMISVSMEREESWYE